MRAAVDISLYPLADEFIPAIQDFIERVNAYPGLAVITNRMSTQIVGDFDTVMDVLREEISTTFRAEGKAVFVLKILNASEATGETP